MKQYQKYILNLTEFITYCAERKNFLNFVLVLLKITNRKFFLNINLSKIFNMNELPSFSEQKKLNFNFRNNFLE